MRRSFGLEALPAGLQMGTEHPTELFTSDEEETHGNRPHSTGSSTAEEATGQQEREVAEGSQEAAEDGHEEESPASKELLRRNAEEGHEPEAEEGKRRRTSAGRQPPTHLEEAGVTARMSEAGIVGPAQAEGMAVPVMEAQAASPSVQEAGLTAHLPGKLANAPLPADLRELRKIDVEAVFRTKWGPKSSPCTLGTGQQGRVTMVMRREDGVMCARKHLRSYTAAETQREIELLRIIARAPQQNLLLPLAFVWASAATIDSIIFEMCDETLEHRFRRQAGILEGDLTVRLVRDMVHGIAHLHSLGFAHRDLKMDNTLLRVGEDGQLRLKLADFGWSKVKQETASPATAAYADVYKPPEIVLGLPYATSADIWVLGVLTRELVTGRQVWRECAHVVALRHCLGDPFPEAVPDLAWRVFWPRRPEGSTAAERLQKDSRCGERPVRPSAVNFIEATLQLLPEQRPRACDLKHHPFVRIDREAEGQAPGTAGANAPMPALAQTGMTAPTQAGMTAPTQAGVTALTRKGVRSRTGVTASKLAGVAAKAREKPQPLDARLHGDEEGTGEGAGRKEGGLLCTPQAGVTAPTQAGVTAPTQAGLTARALREFEEEPDAEGIGAASAADAAEEAAQMAGRPGALGVATCACGYACGNKAKQHKQLVKRCDLTAVLGERKRKQSARFPCSNPAAQGSKYCEACLCLACGTRCRVRGDVCNACRVQGATPESDSVWDYMHKFQASLHHMVPRDIRAFLEHGAQSDTLGNATAALLWEPTAMRAFWATWEPEAAKAGLTAHALRSSLMAAVRASASLQKKHPEAYQEEYGALVAGRMARHLGVARTAMRLGVLRGVGSPQDKSDSSRRKRAPQQCFALGISGKLYAETHDNKPLELFVEAFANPWVCQDMNPFRRPAELGIAWTGAKVGRQVAELIAKYKSLPSHMQLSGGYLLQHSVRKHLLKATAAQDFLAGVSWARVSWEDFRVHSPDEHEHLRKLPAHWSVQRLAQWLPSLSPLLFSCWACCWGGLLGDSRCRAAAASTSAEEFEQTRRRLPANSSLRAILEAVGDVGAESTPQPQGRAQAEGSRSGTKRQRIRAKGASAAESGSAAKRQRMRPKAGVTAPTRAT